MVGKLIRFSTSQEVLNKMRDLLEYTRNIVVERPVSIIGQARSLCALEKLNENPNDKDALEVLEDGPGSYLPKTVQAYAMLVGAAMSDALVARHLAPAIVLLEDALLKKKDQLDDNLKKKLLKILGHAERFAEIRITKVIMQDVRDFIFDS